MNRRNIVIACALLTAFIFCILGIGFAGEKSKRHHYKKKGFSIEIPTDWEIMKENQDIVALIALSPQKKPSDNRGSVCVIVEPKPKDIETTDDCLKKHINYIGKTFKDFKKHDSGETKIGDNNAVWLSYSFRMKKYNNMELKAMDYILVKGKRVYVINCSAPVEAFSGFAVEFKKILGSFKFE